MPKRALILPFVVSLATVAALLWLLGPAQKPVGAAPVAPSGYVAETGTETLKDCAAPAAPGGAALHALDAASTERPLERQSTAASPAAAGG